VLSFSFLRSVSFVLGVLLYFRVTPFVAAPVAVVSVCAILSCCRGSHTLVQPRQITSMLLNLPNPASVRTGSVDCAFCASVIDHLSYESFWSFSLRRFSSLHVAHFAARLARFGPTEDDLSPQRRAYDYFFFLFDELLHFFCRQSMNDWRFLTRCLTMRRVFILFVVVSFVYFHLFSFLFIKPADPSVTRSRGSRSCRVFMDSHPHLT